MLLEGKRLLITGVLTRQSIAYHVARRAQQHGAELLLTGFGRARSLTERTAKRLDRPAEVIELDVNSDGDLAALPGEVERTIGGLDGVLHAIAFAPDDAIGGNFLSAPRESAELAFRTSAYSLKALTCAVLPLLARSSDDNGRPVGASVVGLDFDATVAWPIYDWMGVAKASLESVARYLARDLGTDGVRVNLVSAGPLKTMAAKAISGFGELAALWETQAPLGWDIGDPGPVADTICFLLSDMSAAISGEILHVDGGFHALGAPALGATMGALARVATLDD